MQSVNVSFPSSTGLTLAGTIDFPDTPPKAYAIFAHCFAGSRHTPGASRVSKRLAHHGIATLRFDFPGLGQSEGEYRDTCFSHNVNDLVAAYEWMRAHYSAPQLMIGHSLGGAATLCAAATKPELDNLQAVATIGAPFDPAHSVHHYADAIPEAEKEGEVTVNLGGRDLVISKEFLIDLAETNPEDYLPQLSTPLLIVHSPTDTTVGIDNAQGIFQLTRYPKSLVALHKADHLLTRQGTGARAADTIYNWFEFYLNDESPRPELSIGEVQAVGSRGTRMGAVARTAFDSMPVDASKKQGGKGLGHEARSLLAAAVASASVQAVRAAGRKMELDDVRVNVTVEEEVLRRSIELIGNLAEAEREELLDAGRRDDISSTFGITVRDS